MWNPIGRRGFKLTVAAGLAALVALALLLVGSTRGAVPAAAQDQLQAGVIVQVDEHAQAVRQIDFSGAISGLQLLQLSGLDIATASFPFGQAVCSIEGVGCPADNCFCDPDRFWHYRYWDGSDWQDYGVGASASVISRTGAIEGWQWGGAAAVQSPPTAAVAVAQALVAWRVAQSITDGGYGSAGATVETLLAVGANHEDGDAWQRSGAGPSAADYIAVYGASFARGGPAAAGKLAVALSGANLCLPAGSPSPAATYDTASSAFSLESGPNSWAILGALAISQTAPAAALTRCANKRLPTAAGNGRRGGAPTAIARRWLYRRCWPPASGLVRLP